MKFKHIIFSILILLLVAGCAAETGTVTEKEAVGPGDAAAEDRVAPAENVIKIYLSADRTGTKESGISIEQGIRTALSEVNNEIAGHKIELEILDHRGSTPRADKHLEQYLGDETALAIFSGLHSPPLLASRDYINQNKILMLDPWAAAGPITRHPSAENWIFRLSVDDTKAGFVIADYAVQKEGFKKPFLILEDTGWGKSNEKTMTAALSDMGVTPAGLEWFNWNLGINQAKVLLRKAHSAGADVIFFVGNAPEGKDFAKGMSQLPEDERLPIRSHWGITGGDFPQVIGPEVREKIDLVFIQTSFSFITMGDHPTGNLVFEEAKTLFPEQIETVADIKAPTGFVHAYDLTKILLAAVDQTGLSGAIKSDRDNIRLALENLQTPVTGLIKEYNSPFSVFGEDNPDAHEALSQENFVMAKYGPKNEIILLK